ncbi:MAG: glycosyltransferase family 39 protein [Candidatus Kapabacteria bacterium]|nr:glycosyltransferase family 39 protein [Candidatus Kapabacteria bacterium]
MRENIEKNVLITLQALLIIISSYYILVFLFISIQRVGYPYELEMMEGGMLENAIRLNEGKPLYTEPTLDYIPFIYPPMYSFISVFSIKIFGENFFSLRLISLTSIILTFLIIFLFVRKETGNTIFALGSAGLFAGFYQITAFWFDLARVDSLFLLFIILSLYVLRFNDKIYGLILSAIFAIFAFLTKQSTLMILLPISIYLILNYKFKSLYFILTFAFGILLTTIIFNYYTNGWYSFWVFELPSSHEWNFKYLLSFWSYDVFKHSSLIFIMSLLWIILLSKEKEQRIVYFYMCLMIGVLISAWLQRLHLGGYVNANIPFYAFFSIIFPLALLFFDKKLKTLYHQNNLFSIIIYVIILSQLLTLNYNPSKAIPSEADRIAGDKIVKKIKEIEGNVYIPNHGYLCRYAGKKNFAHWVGYLDVMISKSEIKYKLENELKNKLENKYFSAIIINEDFSHYLIDEYYKKSENVFVEDAFFTISQKTRPQYIYIPK